MDHEFVYGIEVEKAKDESWEEGEEDKDGSGEEDEEDEDVEPGQMG